MINKQKKLKYKYHQRKQIQKKNIKVNQNFKDKTPIYFQIDLTKENKDASPDASNIEKLNVFNRLFQIESKRKLDNIFLGSIFNRS